MITLNAGELSKALSFIYQAYKKPMMPILGNVKFEVIDGVAKLSYTNLEQELTYSLPVVHKEPEAFTVELKKLRDRVSQYEKESDIKIKYDEVKLKATVSCGRSKITINGLPSTDYPDSREAVSYNDVEFDGSELKHALAVVKVAQGVNDVRQYLNGVLMEFTKDSCAIVATDGHRLHVFEMPVTTELNQSCIVPASAIAPLHKFLDSGNITVRISANSLRISDEESSIQTRLVDDSYPNWRRVVPVSNSGELTFNTSDLTNAIKGSLVTSNEKLKGIRLTSENGLTKIESNSPDNTFSEDVIECAMTGVDSIEFGVNGVYILDALASIEESNVTLLVNNGVSSILIKENEYSAVVMPMKL